MTEAKGKGVFSVRADAEAIQQWKLYAAARGMTVTELTAEAMHEYTEAHPLEGDHLKMYKLLLKQAKK